MNARVGIFHDTSPANGSQTPSRSRESEQTPRHGDGTQPIALKWISLGGHH